MDHFGIGHAIHSMLLTYRCASRGTGRTTSLMESLRDGDRVVCASQGELRIIQNLCRERDLNVTCVCIQPQDAREIFTMSTSQGRTLFDHTWVEAYYGMVIHNAQVEIDHLQRQSSGYGTAHIETKRAMIERSKWGEL